MRNTFHLTSTSDAGKSRFFNLEVKNETEELAIQKMELAEKLLVDNGYELMEEGYNSEGNERFLTFACEKTHETKASEMKYLRKLIKTIR